MFEIIKLSPSPSRSSPPKQDAPSTDAERLDYSCFVPLSEYDDLNDEDEALSRAIELSMQDTTAAIIPPPPPSTVPRSSSYLDEENKDEETTIACRMGRMRQPSDTEAQEVASAYLGGGMDDHDGLLSSVLVKECVSHFVESTRMASDGTDEASAIQEFQSLHPYFGKCEYARGVSIDSSYRCLRIVFDHRCRLGGKSKLSFFADPECEDRIGVVDNAMTTSGHLLPDLIIHSHQFWFRFVASEENAMKDNGYGYRFQVKPMANIRWTKETEVLVNPSLDWACWVLELLLNDATELVAHGAVHNRKIYVTALGIPKEKQLAIASAVDMEILLQKLVGSKEGLDDTSQRDCWTEEMDLQLVDWVNNHVEPAASLPTSTPAMTRRSIELQPTDIRLSQTLDGLRCSKLLELPLESLQLRFALLKYLNLSLHHCLPMIDLRDTKSPWTIAHRLRQLSHCIFFDVKSTLVEAAIEATNVSGESSNAQQTARITLDRMQALESRDDREVEPSVSECFFAQAFRQLHEVDPALFRRQIDSKGRLFSVKFRGEEGVDWGGVYREGATSMVDDLFSPHFNLFVLCPNGQHDTGNNRGMYLPNPKCTSPVAMQMFAFVGQLLGISLRTHGDFPFMLPSLVWKQLLGQPLMRADLEGTDAMLIQMLDGIANCENDGISTEEEFTAAFAGLELRFTASSCTGEELELVPGGRQRTVNFHNRLEYCRLAERARLEECSAQVSAMAQGLATLFPRRVLTLLTWQELEILTCGSPKIDLNLWKRHTRYDGYAEDDPTVQLFWEALAEFSDEQRADFVRFAWGRSRLPRGKWPQPFKLSKKGGRDAIRSLPVAHTCFFSVELPPYTSQEIMRSMLLATITFGLGGILMA
ncbi:regulator of chromosome condensation [Phytophthora boehmeriae]|uniref:Regulator of chromosome condensation n=1 Tax=Phytophthora boehmeriae TaxID=109152 RepID=A0A8T1WN56_9STRA|nr:regulator of chromosome condensation [Phytophthora boehmeriae]